MNKIFSVLLLVTFSFSIISCSNEDSSGATSQLGQVLDQPNSTDDENKITLPVVTIGNCELIDNSAIDNSTVDNSRISDNSSIKNSTVNNCSTVTRSIVDNSSTIDNSTISYSTINNSSVCDSTFDNATVDNSTVCYGNVSFLIENQTIRNQIMTEQTDPILVDNVSITSATEETYTVLNVGDNVSVTATFSESVIVDNAEEFYTFTVDASSEVITTSAAHGLVNDDTVTVTTSVSDLPAGLAVDTTYYVLTTPASNTLTVSEAKDGSVVNITDTGSGTHTLHVEHVAITSCPTGDFKCDPAVPHVVSTIATFSENVIVTGIPQLTIFIVNDNRTADYNAAASGNALLVFNYTLVDGEEPLDNNGIRIGANAIDLNGGTIKDAAGNDATITHNLVPDNRYYKVK